MTLAKVVPLGWDHASELSMKLHQDDASEVFLSGRTPLASLAFACTLPHSYAILDTEGFCKGAYGVTPAGIIWSLWGSVDWREARQILRNTPDQVRVLMAYHSQSHERLYNYVWTGNKRALKWLRLSKCFAIDPHLKDINGASFHYFETKHPREFA